jgi:hypothetical protein
MSRDFDRILALEDEARLLRRDLEDEHNERTALEGRLKVVEERLLQAESDVKDAHDRVQNVEDRVALVEDQVESREFVGEQDELVEIDEGELGEAGA